MASFAMLMVFADKAAELSRYSYSTDIKQIKLDIQVRNLRM